MKIYHLDLKTAMYNEYWLLDFFERLKENGFDGLCVEIDNKLIFPSHPSFAAPDALSAYQWHQLLEQARDIGLETYPLIQTLGHMEHILTADTPLRRLAESPGNNYQFCPSKESTINFVRDLVQDVYHIFGKPSRIHLGGDECRGMGICPRCTGRSTSELLVGYMQQLHEIAASHEMQLELWADMVLANPETLDQLPTDICFIDWLYARTEVRSPRLRYCFGYPETRNEAGLPADELLAGLPPHLEPLRPYLVDGDGNCNIFFGAHFLKAKGFKTMVASGVRSGGDSYALPRTRRSMLNVGATELAAQELGIDHLVTSWAVRLSHPETTWPAMLATNLELDGETLANVGASIGGLNNDMLDDLDIVQEAIEGIDRLAEHLMRYQRPFYGDLLGHIENIRQAPDAAEQFKRIEARIEAAKRLIAIFEQRDEEGLGDGEVLQHWIDALNLIELRSRQCLVLAQPDCSNGELLTQLAVLVEENRHALTNFADLWKESLTTESLLEEIEVKFKRDIRTLTEIIG